MIVFDVGANDGSSTIHLAMREPGVTFYAFEPTPQLVERIREKSRHLPNYHVVPKAVSNFSGKSTFNVAGHHDWGCSSLHAFSENLAHTWPGREEFYVTEVIEVEVIKLRDFVLEQGISEIGYMHIDVQGDDLNVLRGLEDKLPILVAGDLEVALNREVALYHDQHTMAEVEAFLDANGFKINATEQNDQLGNEFNVYFSRK